LKIIIVAEDEKFSKELMVVVVKRKNNVL